ncbi:hypothetical protein AGMMS50230_16810 [Spirochaetia bacterium]|nr:hypothetical protein AGMMS50230_16810 [Spirochaetia bacterium]
MGGFQLVLLTIAGDFTLNAAMMGVLVSAQYIAITLSPLAFGWIADRIGKKPILLIFMPVFILGCLAAGSSGGTVLFIAGVFIAGIGYSVCECIGSSAVSDSFPGKESRYLNIMQCFFSLGAVISPLFFKWLLSTGIFSWRIVFFVSGCGYVLLYPFLIVSRCSKPEPVRTAETQSLTMKKLFHSSFFITMMFSMLAYVAIETGTAYFADSLFVMEYDNKLFGAYAISAFWFAMTISRFAFAWIKLKKRTMILMGFSLSFLFLVLLILTKDQRLLLGLFALIGAAAGPVWPMIVGMGTMAYQEKSGTVASLLTASGGLGGALIPVLIGAVTENWGVNAGFCLLIAASALGFFVMKKGGIQKS